MSLVRNILAVAAGGALGSVARYLCQRWVSSMWPGAFPLGTFAINVVGCFLIGIFWGMGSRSEWVTEQWRFFLIVGVCGGYTTFSSFTLEGVALLREHKHGTFLLYIGASVILGLLATWIGLLLTMKQPS